MKPDDIIQTRKYKSKGYAGRKIQVVQIQDDIEINNCMVTGFSVLKDGSVTSQIIEVLQSDLPCIQQ